MKKLRFFDSLKLVLAAIACVFAIIPAHAATLPAGYTELQYIESTGTQYINTGIGDNTSSVLVKAVAQQTENTGESQILFGVTASGSGGTYFGVGGAAVNWGFGATVANGMSTIPATTKATIELTFNNRGGTATINGETVSRWKEQSTVRGPLAIFAAPSNGGYYGKYKLWSCEVYQNDVLVRNFIPAKNASDVVGMYDTVSGQFFTNAGTGEFVAGEWQIKIATTKYSEAQFAPVETRLDAAVAAVDTVVSQTMTQAQAIDTIATTKQTRPDESCPPFKKCLLVEDEDGTPHWYEIYDPINDFLRPILAAAGLSGNQGAPIMTTHTENGSTLYDTFNGFFNGSGAFRKKYIDNTASAADRPFGPTTLARCADNATRTTSTVNAGICYNTGGMFRELTEGADDDAGEWALVWNGNEGGASLGITPGVVYGIAKCTTVGQHTTQMTGDVADGSNYWWPKKLTAYSGGGTTLASLIEQYPNSNVETVFNTLPNPYGTDDNPEYPRANYRNCWCKMTEIGVGGSGDTFAEQAANGTIMSVSVGWVFDRASTSATNCALDCASSCAYRVRAGAAFRRAVLGVGAN